ncbi:unnamed protein product [Oppiella nova]|uniref:FHA domain-containing protein n=1 Tax=Oppiella nova TaxID=334625 RepID=A0A7R9M4I9_9ACAR|nr:unnamed protein product [Oppiella nova]CAG2170124.1 unnamed protein product [Oppiella nova]
MDSNDDIVFKVPLKTSLQPSDETKESAQEVTTAAKQTEVLDTKPATTAAPKTVLPEPMTRVTPPEGQYFVDQLKNGVLVEHKTVVKSRIVFGRAPDCDVVLEHPSVSRYHSVLLWSPASDDDYLSGQNKDSFWYLVDCGSTHGTTCNKLAVMAGKLIKLIPNNNVFKFGASTRLFSLGTTGDDSDDEEDTTEEDVDEGVEKSKAEPVVDSGCTWGINEDMDTKGEVTGDSRALQAVITAMKSTGSDVQTDNANVYSANPNKCIQQWFEREGYDLEYKCDTVHNKFRCTLELPIDGQWIPVEGSLLPKKKEAITDACLKGCQLLDRAELLFPWQQQEAKELRRKQEEDMDFEVDDMIDETVKISHKRVKRDSESGDSAAKVDNFETLNKKWLEMNEELCQLRVKMANIGAQSEQRPDVSQESGDSLDDYMAVVNRQKYGLTISDKIEKSKIKMKINLLVKEQQKLEKLIKLAKPSVEFKPIPAVPVTDVTKSVETDTQVVKNDEKCETVVKQSDDSVEVKPMSETEKCEKVVEKVSKDEEIARKTETIINELKSAAKPKAESKQKRKLNSQSIVEAIEKEKQLEKTKQKATFDDDYVDWLPPTGQSGDGKTSLNDKFGY